MKNSLWTLIIVVIGIIAFLLGYSVPSFRQAGGPVSEERKAGPEVKMDKSTQDYYQNLQKDEN